MIDQGLPPAAWAGVVTIGDGDAVLAPASGWPRGGIVTAIAIAAALVAVACLLLLRRARS